MAKTVPKTDASDKSFRGVATGLTPHAQYWYLQVGLAGLGGVLLIAGFSFALPIIINAGGVTLAAAAVVSGLASVLTRRIVFLWPSRRYRLVAGYGFAAVLSGLAFVAIGIAAMLAVLAHVGGMSVDQIRDGILDRPWRALIPVGFFMLANGLAMVVGFGDGPDAHRSQLWNLLMSIPSRLGGLIGLALGAAAMYVGCYELLDPQAFDDFIERLSHRWPW